MGARTPVSAARQRRARRAPSADRARARASAADGRERPRRARPSRSGAHRRSAARRRRPARSATCVCGARALAAGSTRSRPVMPRWIDARRCRRVAVDARRGCTCPARRTPAIACPTATARSPRRSTWRRRCSGCPLHHTASMRRPRSARRSPRTIVSTSGSSGMRCPRRLRRWPTRVGKRVREAREVRDRELLGALRFPAMPLAASAAASDVVAERPAQRPPQHLAPGRERLLDDGLEQRRVAHRRQRRRARHQADAPTRSRRARDETIRDARGTGSRASACCATATVSRP